MRGNDGFVNVKVFKEFSPNGFPSESGRLFTTVNYC